MLLVLVGHKLSAGFRLEARISCRHLEYKLIKELPESVRQGYIACKYVMKCFLEGRRGPDDTGGGRSHVGSYHTKTVFLRFLEKKSPSLIISPFGLFLDLFNELEEYLKVGKLPHYFLAQCDLLETSPTNPQQIYGEVSPDHIVVTFCRVADHPTCEQSQKGLFRLLARVDKRRQEKFREQVEMDSRILERMSKRDGITGLVAMLKQINQS